MTMIKQLLKVKGRGCITIGPEQTVYSAIEKMAENRYGWSNARRRLHRT